MTQNYDVIVIGSGGGTKLVRPVAKLGLKVAIIERESLGGTCLNRGCIPSKMLIHVADLAASLREMQRFELEVNPSFQVNFPALIKRVSDTIDEESQSIEPLYENDPNIDLIKGEARFICDKTLEVNSQRLTADKIFIATGCEASVPNIKGLANTPFMTYRQALRSSQLPKSLIVLGGGYIATELGYFFSALGSEVQFIVRSGLLRQEDEEIAREFTRLFCEHEKVLSYTQTLEVSYENEKFSVLIETQNKEQKKIEAEQLLVATGVSPNTQTLGLEHTGVKLNSQGFIQVDSFLETTRKGIYAFGDVLGKNLFRHNANFEGEYLFEQLFQSVTADKIDYPPMPHAVFTFPQVAGVGKTEQQLIKENIPYFKGVNSYSQSAMGMALLSEGGLVKLLFEKNTHKLLGAHIVGPEASNMIHILIAFMNKQGSLEDLLRMIYIHPALPEIVRNAARKAKATLD